MAQFQQQIGASNDDTYAKSDTNNPTAVQAMFGHTISGGKAPIHYYWDAFLRFLLNIPKGSTINLASLTLHAYVTRADDFVAQITYTDEDDAADFSTNPFGRADAMTPLNWVVPDFTACQTLQTCDIKDVIQSFINRAGYNENNHIAIRIKWGDAAAGEYQQFYQYDGVPANAAILIIDYTPPGAPPAGYAYSDGLVCVQVAG